MSENMARHRLPFALVFLAISKCSLARPYGAPENIFEIQWKANCTEGVAADVDCGTLEVPMDWTDPSHGFITIDVSRFRTNSSQRIGALFVNPGGPGGSPSVFCQDQEVREAVFSSEVRSHFDIVCPEPRGVGPSSAVKCDEDIWIQTPSYFIEDETSFNDVLAFNKKLSASCLNLTGPVLGFVDTTNTAKDLDAIRIALGEEKLSWLGFSYGSQLGAAYAELFPHNFRAMVLDGNVDHSQSSVDGFVTANWGMEDELSRLFKWCDGNSTCAFHGVNNSAADAWVEMISNANASPIPAPGCAMNATGTKAGTCKEFVTGYDIIFNLENHFQQPQTWPKLSEWIKEAMDGNATRLSTPFPHTGDFANLAIGCLDWQMNVTTFEEYQSLKNLGEAMFPYCLGSSMWLQFATTCIGWPFAPSNPQHFLNSSTMSQAPPILQLQSTHDPATPLPWAHNLLPQIPSAVLLTRSGDGHCSYGSSIEMTSLADDYLVNLTLPDAGAIVYDVANNPAGGFRRF